MEESILRMDAQAARDWEYLGSVSLNGRTYLALRQADGQARLFTADASVCRRVADAEAELAAWRKLRQAAAEAASGGARPGLGRTA